MGEEAIAEIMGMRTLPPHLFAIQGARREVESRVPELTMKDLALLVSHTKLVVVGVTIDYRIAPLEVSA